MKSIKIITRLLTLVYFTFSANAQTTGDTVKINYKGKNYTIPTSISEDEEESNKTLRFSDTITKRIVTIKVKSAKTNELLSVFGDSISKKQKFINTFKERNVNTKHKHFIETDFFTDLCIGFTGINSELNTPLTSSLSPRVFRSVNTSITVMKLNMNLYKNKIKLQVGIGSNNYFLKYKNTQNLLYLDGAGRLNNYKDTVNNIRKNRMDISYITFPIILEYNNKKDKFKIAAGVEFGIAGTTKLTIKGNLDDGTFKTKRDVDLKINPMQMNAIFKIGFENISLFGRYTLTSMFKDNAFANGQNPNQNLFSIGVCVGGF